MMERLDQAVGDLGHEVIDLRSSDIDEEVLAAADIVVWALAREAPHRRWAIVERTGRIIAKDPGGEWALGAALAQVQLDDDDAMLEIVTDVEHVPADSPEAVAARATARLLLAVVTSNRRTRQAELAADRAWVVARMDPVARVLNARGWWDRIEGAVAADPGDLLIACVAIANLAAINDRHGHLHGDLVLRVTAESLLELLGADDLVARLGGANFMVLAHRLDPDELAEAIVAAVAVDGVAVRVGVACQQPDEPIRATMARADLDQRGGPVRVADLDRPGHAPAP